MKYLLVLLFMSLFLLPVKSQSFPSPTIFAVDFSPDGTKLAIGSTEGLSIIDSATHVELTNFQTDSSIVYTLDWSPDGTKLVSSGD